MIKLSEKIGLSADQHQYIVGNPRKRMGQAGEYTELGNPQYFTTMASALSAALSRAMRMEVESGTIATMQGYLDRQQQMIAEFTALIEPLYGRYVVVQAGQGGGSE